MEQTCRHCNWEVVSWQRYCGGCGAAVQRAISGLAEALPAKTVPQGQPQILVVRGGASMMGSCISLDGEEHLFGRTEGDVNLPDDRFVSPKHARFRISEGVLSVCDVGSCNGTYLRVRGPRVLEDSTLLLIGEQLLRFNLYRPGSDNLTEEETFSGTPLRPSRIQITQIYEGGKEGLVVGTRRRSIVLGREGCDINFPEDSYISNRHCRIEEANNQFYLADLDSSNGTFLRLDSQTDVALEEGDELFLGRHLLRVQFA